MFDGLRNNGDIRVSGLNDQLLPGMVNGSKNGNPPPLPPRPQRDNWSRIGSAFNSCSPFGFGYSSPYHGGYGGAYGGYNTYGYNRYSGFGFGSGSSNESDFFRIAEEGSRQAFQSIESIVQAFGSVSMMLESTYFALQSSFRAVLGVAEHMSQLKDNLSTVIASLSILRGIRYVLKTILQFLGILKRNQNDEAVWKIAEASVGDNSNNDALLNSLAIDSTADSRSSWPILVFFAVVCGTPWLFWRLIASITGKTSKENAKWKTGESDHYIATAIYDFETDSSKEVPFRAGQRIVIAPKNLQPRVRGWLLACVDNKTGLIPNNYIKVIGFNRVNKCSNDDKGDTT
ncbi:peroxisome biogenesis factor 13-like isoform X2 [Leptotrombidium deliense]|uniref:Peroxisomal membrane protein PEX13 n=1 Tax=Leptotrombidium deliense TaxID=299467 RepID=A0A443SK77_9ACAR|nr:peroxisome biogenesis factor 13-like isoform X2 [Leptotrombidium deliense]